MFIHEPHVADPGLLAAAGAVLDQTYPTAIFGDHPALTALEVHQKALR